MTDLRTELEKILLNYLDWVSIKNLGESIEEEKQEAITAIEKLIEKRENELYLKWMKNMFKQDYITRQEAYEKCCDSLDLPIAVQPYGEERYKTWKALRTAFKIPEGKE